MTTHPTVTGSRRSLVLPPAWQGQESAFELAHLAAIGARARTDYVELARALDADVMDWQYFQDQATPIARAVARRAGFVPAQLVEGFLRRNRYRHMVAKADRLGLPLALLFKIARSRRDLALISVWLSKSKKAVFLRPLDAHSHLKAIICASSVQMGIAEERLGVPSEKLHFALQPADERFWRPQDMPVEDMICSVGAESRDYATLVAAVRGLDVQTEVAVGAIVLRTGDVSADLSSAVRPLVASDLPAQIRVRQQLDNQELRRLYARSRFVVVPLEDVEFDAGVTVIAEAMAMGKAVVVTRARGQRDLVREGETGLHVPPRDPRALRAAIEYLLGDLAAAERMGRAARQVVEAHLRLDQWVEKVVQAMGRRHDEDLRLHRDVRAATIRTAIASILGQSCSDWELIVVGQGHRDELQTAQHWWSYLSSQNRRVSLVQNLAIRALPRARMLFKLDDDVFIVERFYCSRIMTVVHNVSAVHFSFGAQDQTMRSMFGDRLAQF